MNENWINDMQRKLEGHKMDPPPGLWESICERMGIEPEPVSVKKPAAIKRWYWAAAAVVLALAGFFAFYNQGGDEAGMVSNEPVDISSEPVKISSGVEKPVFSKKPVIVEQPSGSLLAVQSHEKEMKDSKPEEETVLEQADKQIVMEEHEEADMGYKVDNLRDSVEQSHEPAPVIPITSNAFTYPEYPAVANQEHDSDAGRWTVGLNASGGLLAANSVRAGRVYYSQEIMNGYAKYSQTDMNGYAYYWGGIGKSDDPYSSSYVSFYQLTEHISKHRLPVRFGLSLQYQLNPSMALLSGVSYTRLYSEFSFPLYKNISYSQRLHYIGIPFGVAWQLWTANHFSLYLSGGAMVEKCVDVSLDGDYTGKKPWQWSLNAAAGAEYALTSQFGVYLEPSLGYYFSDGTQLEHYYKEHPLAPSIEFGLRMHLGR